MPGWPRPSEVGELQQSGRIGDSKKKRDEMKEKSPDRRKKKKKEAARGGLDQGRGRTSRQETGCRNKGGALQLRNVEASDSNREDNNGTWPFIKHQKALVCCVTSCCHSARASHACLARTG